MKHIIMVKRLLVLAQQLISADGSYHTSDLPFMDEEHDLLGHIQQDERLFSDLQRKVGKIGRFIKSGANGSVYEVSDASQVLKLTSDPQEVKAANILLKSKMEEAVEVFGVWILPDLVDRDGDKLNAWAILMEKLYPLGDRERKFIMDFHSVKPAMGVVRERAELFEKSFKDKYPPAMFEWLKKAADNLKERGIVNRDMHKNNVMMRKTGQMAIIDMGGGSKSPDSTVEELSAMLLAAARIMEGTMKHVPGRKLSS